MNLDAVIRLIVAVVGLVVLIYGVIDLVHAVWIAGAILTVVGVGLLAIAKNGISGLGI